MLPTRTVACCAALTAVVGAALGAGPAAALQYGYAGNDFTNIIDNTPPPGTTYTTSDSVSGSFQINGQLAPNQPLTDISGSVVSYQFTDGVATLNQGNSSLSVSVATDGAGQIVEWQLTAATGDPLTSTPGSMIGDQREVIQTNNVVGQVLDRGILQECVSAGPGGCSAVFSDVGFTSNNAGSWSIVPEPGTAALVVLGLLGMAGARRRATAVA